MEWHERGVGLRRTTAAPGGAEAVVRLCALAASGGRSDQLLPATELLPARDTEREPVALRAAHARCRRADGRRDRGRHRSLSRRDRLDDERDLRQPCGPGAFSLPDPAGAGRGIPGRHFGRGAQRLLRSHPALPADRDDLRDKLHFRGVGIIRAPRAGWRHAAGVGELLLYQSPWTAHGAVGGSYFAAAVGAPAVDALRALPVRDGGTGSVSVCQRRAGLVGALPLVLYRGADGGRRGARAGP